MEYCCNKKGLHSILILHSSFNWDLQCIIKKGMMSSWLPQKLTWWYIFDPTFPRRREITTSAPMRRWQRNKMARKQQTIFHHSRWWSSHLAVEKKHFNAHFLNRVFTVKVKTKKLELNSYCIADILSDTY
jgi:hypothetical protein